MRMSNKPGGIYPISSGKGEWCGVYTPLLQILSNQKNFKKKIQKKNKKFRAFKKFGELKIFIYLCQSKMI